MNDIINKIIEIDDDSYKNQEKKKLELLNIRRAYEEAISIYKKEKLDGAKQSAKSIAEKMDLIVNNEKEKQKTVIKKISTEIDRKYRNMEKVLIEKLLDELFVMEG